MKNTKYIIAFGLLVVACLVQKTFAQSDPFDFYGYGALTTGNSSINSVINGNVGVGSPGNQISFGGSGSIVNGSVNFQGSGSYSGGSGTVTGSMNQNDSEVGSIISAIQSMSSTYIGIGGNSIGNINSSQSGSVVQVGGIVQADLYAPNSTSVNVNSGGSIGNIDVGAFTEASGADIGVLPVIPEPTTVAEIIFGIIFVSVNLYWKFRDRIDEFNYVVGEKVCRILPAHFQSIPAQIGWF